MGKEMKDMKETALKTKVQKNEYRGLIAASSLATVLSFVVYWAVGMINTLYYTSEFRYLYTLMLLGSALFSLICFVVCMLAVFKIKKRRYLYIIFAVITFAIMCLELASAALFNSFR